MVHVYRSEFIGMIYYTSFVINSSPKKPQVRIANSFGKLVLLGDLLIGLVDTMLTWLSLTKLTYQYIKNKIEPPINNLSSLNQVYGVRWISFPENALFHLEFKLIEFLEYQVGFFIWMKYVTHQLYPSFYLIILVEAQQFSIILLSYLKKKAVLIYYYHNYWLA